MHKDTARQGEHLRLVLQAAEGCREDKAVVVALELRAVVVAQAVAMLLAEALVGDKSLPIHNEKHWGSRRGQNLTAAARRNGRRAATPGAHTGTGTAAASGQPAHHSTI